jgi:hypothetical protein
MRWENPPAARPGRHASTKTQAEKDADELRKHPGEWALVEKDAHAAKAYQVKAGKVKAYQPAGAFEAVIRSTPKHSKDRGRLYIRYVGEEPES